MPPGALLGLGLAGFLILFTPIGGVQRSNSSQGGSSSRMTDQQLVEEVKRRGLGR